MTFNLQCMCVGEGIVRVEGGEQNKQKNCQNVLIAQNLLLIGVCLPALSNAFPPFCLVFQKGSSPVSVLTGQ